MGRSALGILLAVAAGSTLLGFGLAATIRTPSGTSVPAGGDPSDERRLREENERLRARLSESRSARAPAAPVPETRAAAAPAPVAERAPATDVGSPPMALDPASQVKACLDGLRAVCAAGDGPLAEKYRLLLVGLGGIARDPLADVARDRGEPEMLRAQALLALQRLRAPDLADVVAGILEDPSSSPSLRTAALAAAAGAPASPSLVASARSIAWNPSAPAEDRGGAVAILAAAAPEEAVPILRAMLASADRQEWKYALGAIASTRNRAFLPLLRDHASAPQTPANVNEVLGVLAALKDRPWSALQMTGEPDTVGSGDLGTAWAAKGQEMGEVWIELDYERAVVPEQVRIRETLCPGGVVRVLARRPDGDWEPLWEGTADPESPPRWFAPPLAGTALATSTIRLVLDTNRVQGWEEIDAVELVGGGGSQWAKAARSSSSYADPQ